MRVSIFPDAQRKRELLRGTIPERPFYPAEEERELHRKKREQERETGGRQGHRERRKEREKEGEGGRRKHPGAQCETLGTRSSVLGQV